jgi:peptide/nickel transport system permease protein
MRNALIPIVTLFGLDFGLAFGSGAILTESVFGLQGIGQYVADSVGSLDLPPIMGTTLYAAFFVVLFSALVDIVYARLDPRVRLDA